VPITGHILKDRMSSTLTSGVRLRMALTFAAACVVIGAFTLATVRLHGIGVEHAAVLEARHLAESVAYGAVTRLDDASAAQRYLVGLDSMYRRDLFIVDAQKRVIADVEVEEVGSVFTGDRDNEVGLVMHDGQPRVFSEAMPGQAEPARLIAVPIRAAGAIDGTIVGAVGLEYSNIEEELRRDSAWQVRFAAAGGLISMLLVCAFGMRLHVVIRQLTEKLQASYELLHVEMDKEKASAQQIEHIAFHDALTGLPNRTLFSRMTEQALEEARRYQRRLAVMFVDLDRFKNINDTLGHEAGDALLQQVAERLGATLRDSDTVARMGGDEFVILVRECEDEAALAVVADKLLAAVARPVVCAGQEFRVTASVGIAIYPADGLDEATLMKHADIAMYQAKEDGKNTYAFYVDDINHHSVERLAFESNLRRALEQEQFELHFQPKVEAQSGRMTGVEALLRWRHPDLGLVAPGKFISIAEETGLIVPIGRWVLRTACAQQVAWQRAGLPPLRMAVNLSARQFADEHLLTDVEAIVRESGIAPDNLEIEITESVLMLDVTKALKVLDGFKALGIRMSIDDFGTGYSSLGNLKRFPVNSIKVDRAFVRDLPTSREDRAIADAVIAMGRTLGMSVVAEGVETGAQADFLRERGCDEIQGFYYSRPVPGRQIEQLLDDSPSAVLSGLDAPSPRGRGADSAFMSFP
jgi:diguanylate cyclase (GGDEF)-like protein